MGNGAGGGCGVVGTLLGPEGTGSSWCRLWPAGAGLLSLFRAFLISDRRTGVRAGGVVWGVSRVGR